MSERARSRQSGAGCVVEWVSKVWESGVRNIMAGEEEWVSKVRAGRMSG